MCSISVSYFYILRVFQTVDFITRVVVADLACVYDKRIFTHLRRSVVNDSIKVSGSVHGSDIVCLVREKFLAWLLEQFVEAFTHNFSVIDRFSWADFEDHILFQFLASPRRRQILVERVDEEYSARWFKFFVTALGVRQEPELDSLTRFIEVRLGALRWTSASLRFALGVRPQALGVE